MAHPSDTLREITREFRHVQAWHQRKGLDSSRRRRQRQDLSELERKFELVLEHWIDAADRVAWREHFHHGGEIPEESDIRPLLFKGRSDAGALIEIHPFDQHENEIRIDGTPMGRLPVDLPLDPPLRFAGVEYEEVFAAPEAALDALRRYCAEGTGEPPWEWARELYADGLIDPTFGLTPRGRRYYLGVDTDIRSLRRGSAVAGA